MNPAPVPNDKLLQGRFKMSITDLAERTHAKPHLKHVESKEEGREKEKK